MNNNEPIISIYPNGKIIIQPGATIRNVLEALDVAKDSILNIALRPNTEQASEQLEG